MIIKKKLLIIFAILCIAIFFFTCYLYYRQLDTRIAKAFGEAINSCDIEKMDDFLCSTTEIVYQNRKEVYQKLRNNVLNVFNDEKFEAANSYGYSTDSVLSKEKTIRVIYFVRINGKNYENYMEMDVKMNFIGKSEIKEIRGFDSFFEYLFYGKDRVMVRKS